MVIQANGTIAKDIALYFLDMTNQNLSGKLMAKTILQAKALLNSGYSKDDILLVINYFLDKGTPMYSLGYINACISDCLDKAKADLAIKEAKRKQAEHALELQSEVVDDGKSSERNRDKLDRFGTESRFRTESYRDLFERPGQTD